MQAEDSRKAGPPLPAKKKAKTRIIKWTLACVAVLILLGFFLVPVFVSSEKGRKVILAKINSSIAGEMDFAGLSMSWWKGIEVSDISFNDKAGQTEVKVKQVATRPHYGSVLMGSLSFGETVVDEPRVRISLKDKQLDKEGKARRERSAAGEPTPFVPPIRRIDLIVNNGTLKVTGRQPEGVELSRINSKVNLRPPGQRTDFDIDMAVTDETKEARVNADGRITPRKSAGWSLEGASGDFTVEVNDLDLESLGPIFVLAGVELQAKGGVSGNLEGEIRDGRVEKLNGTIKGRDLDVTGSLLKGDRFKTSVLDVGIKLNREKELINIDRLEVKADWLKAKASGDVPTTFGSLAEFVKADSKRTLQGHFECDVAQLASQMPRTLGLKEGMKVTGGRLTGSIEKLIQAGEGKIRGQANLAGLEGTVGGKTIALSEPVTAAVEISSDKAGIKYDKLDVSAAFCKVNCAGSSELLRYEAQLNLAKLQSELGGFIDIGPYQMSGEVFGKGEVSSKKDKITAAGSSVVKNLSLVSPAGVRASEPETEITFSVTAEPKEDVLSIDFLRANASFGRISTNNAVLPLSKKAATPVDLAVSARDIDLAKISQFGVLSGYFPREMTLAGAAESDITVTSKKETYKITTDSTRIRNLKLSYPGQKPFEQEQVSLVFDAEVNPAKAAIKYQVVSPQIKIKGNYEKILEGNKTNLQGRADFEYDWTAVSTVAAPYLPRGLRLHGQRADSIDFSSKYPAGETDKLLANLNTKGKLGFEKAEYMGLNFGPTETDINIQNGLLTVAPFSSTVNNGQLKFAGEADFKQKPTLLKTPGPIEMARDIQIDDETTRKLLMYVNPIFANAVDVRGVANFSCEKLAIPLAGASRRDLEVIGTISISQLRFGASDLLGTILSVVGTSVRGQSIIIRPTRFVLRDGLLRYDDMQVVVGDNPFDFKGVIGLDKSLNMTVTLPYTLKGRTARADKQTVGERISVPLKGTLDKPELDVGKLLEEQLRKQLEQELLKGLEKLLK